tara:strand:- start:3377 stop:3865 length:489 start_codon:yes stop_codon:yes gene_type:complete
MGIDLTLVSTDQQCPLGFIYVDPASANQNVASQGRKEYIYVKAASNIDLLDVCQRLAGTPNYGIPGAAGTGVESAANGVFIKRIVGVATIAAIPAGSYGFIQRRGIGTVVAGAAGLTADTGMIPDTGGTAIDTSGSQRSFGIALNTVAAGNPTLAFLACEGS